MGLESSGVYQQSFTFLSVTLQPLGAYRFTIPHMKEDIHSFNMRYNSMTCTKRLQRYSFWNCLIGPSLVILFSSSWRFLFESEDVALATTTMTHFGRRGAI